MVNRTHMPTHWVWYLIWPLLGALSFGWFAHNSSIQKYHAEALAEFQKFKNVGARFTAIDGKELCEYVAQLRQLHGMTEPPCDYITKANH